MQTNRIILLVSLLAVFVYQGYTQTPCDRTFVLSLPKPIICEGESVRISCEGETLGETQYLWNGPNGWSDVSQNPTVAPFYGTNMSGWYVVTIQQELCEGLIKDSIFVDFTSPPPSPTVSNSTLLYCYKETVTEDLITASGITAGRGCMLKWYIDYGTHAESVSPPISINTDAPGTIMYSVRQTNGRGFCESLPTMISLTVLPCPPETAVVSSPIYAGFQFSITIPSTSVTDGCIYRVYDSPLPESALLASSDEAVANVPVTISGLIAPPASTSYYIATVVDNKESYTRLETPITVKSVATATDITATDINICNNTKLTLNVSANYVSDPVFKWYDTQNSSTALFTGDNYTPDENLIASRNYYVSVMGTNINENIVGDRKEVQVTVSDMLDFSWVKTDVTSKSGSNGEIIVSTLIGGSGGSGWSYSNNDGTTWQSSNIFDNLLAATYQIRVKDSNDCSSSTVNVTIYEPVEFTVPSKNDVTCKGCSDGKITVPAPIGGSGSGWSYSNDGGANWQTSNIFANLPAAIYQIIAKDGIGNSSSTVNVTIYEPIEFTVPSKNDVTCKGCSDGKITVPAPIGGSGSDWTYSNDGGTNWQSSGIFDNLPAAIYQIIAKDGIGNSSSTVNVTIYEPVEFTVPSKNDVTCKGCSDGKITVPAPIGGSGSGWTYSNDGGTNWQSSGIFDNLPAAIYQITAKDGIGNSSSTVNVTIYEPVEFTVPSKNDVTCKGCSDGKITVPAPIGGSGSGWSYSNDGGTNWQSSGIFDNLPAAIYQIIAKDGIGNSSSTVNITIYEPVEFTTPDKTDISCRGCSDGKITVPTPTGGSGADWMYSNDGGATWQYSNFFGNLITAIYRIQAKDGNDNQSPIVNMTIYEPVEFTTPDKTDVSCKGCSDGKITVPTPTGGSGADWMYSNDGGATWQYSNFFGNIIAAIYRIQAKDGNDKQSLIVDVTINEPEPLIINLGKDLVLCKNMKAELNATLADKDAKYRWYKNGEKLTQTSPIITVYEQGTYSVEAITTPGYIVKDTINISTRDYEIAADFAVATETVDDEITKLVNISYPYPDKVEWIIPQSPDVKVSSLSDEYAEIKFIENKSYRVGLHAWKGDCETTVYKDVEITNDILSIDGRNVPEQESKSTTIIKSFIAYPNPNNGQFIVHIELGIKTDVRMDLLSVSGKIINSKILKGSDSYDVFYNINGINGVYIIHLLTGNKQQSSLKLIINSN
jgi:ribosomal protein L6P/L9E